MRVIRTEGADAVVMQIYDALRLAEQEGLDLVEVAPNQTPPVCRLLDYGKFQFVQDKKAREARRTQKVHSSDMREVRLTPNIAEHDIQSKIRSVSGLLDDGSKVRVAVFFRGRQITHPELAIRVLRRVAEGVASKAKLEKPPTMEQRSLSIILSPAAIKAPGAADDGQAEVPTQQSGPAPTVARPAGAAGIRQTSGPAQQSGPVPTPTTPAGAAGARQTSVPAQQPGGN